MAHKSIKRLKEIALQAEASLRQIGGLPLAVAVSDTHPGKLAIWRDNGLFGLGQVAILTDEFSEKQGEAICALVNSMSTAAPLITTLVATSPHSELISRIDQARNWHTTDAVMVALLEDVRAVLMQNGPH